MEVLSQQNDYLHTPFFNHFNASKIYFHFIDASNYDKWIVLQFWKKRYRDEYIDYLKNEINFLEKLLIHFSKRKQKNQFSYYLISDFSNLLIDTIQKLKA
jgi:hypothetical protein